jgi:lysophospholipase L1-like esterase
MRRETDRFRAVAENGDECIIVEYTNFIVVKTTTSQGKGRGSRSYLTSDGRHLNPLSDTEFREIISGTCFVRADE